MVDHTQKYHFYNLSIEELDRLIRDNPMLVPEFVAQLPSHLDTESSKACMEHARKRATEKGLSFGDEQLIMAAAVDQLRIAKYTQVMMQIISHYRALLIRSQYDILHGEEPSDTKIENEHIINRARQVIDLTYMDTQEYELTGMVVRLVDNAAVSATNMILSCQRFTTYEMAMAHDVGNFVDIYRGKGYDILVHHHEYPDDKGNPLFEIIHTVNYLQGDQTKRLIDLNYMEVWSRIMVSPQSRQMIAQMLNSKNERRSDGKPGILQPKKFDDIVH